MWVCLNNAMVSIVEDRDNPQMVFVRARQEQFLVDFMVGSNVYEIQNTPTRDYQYRFHAPKAYVAFRMAEHVLNIDYGNFKASIPDEHPDLKDAYHKIWSESMKSLDARSVHTVWDNIQGK